MHPVAREYVAERTLPPDPVEVDISVHPVQGQNVYSVLPLTMKGYAFVVEHEYAGSAHGDALLVPTRNIVSFLDEVFDEGLRVV